MDFDLKNYDSAMRDIKGFDKEVARVKAALADRGFRFVSTVNLPKVPTPAR
ncbi:hypothetical protein [Limnoglobus roseus]|uniref:hypothetical protein n=1 Tax=Limnoglobus roseus TaxID=2598579 RepID=UPI00143CC814|nr:hypothetical protein [Limnoglobus roseus]